MTQQPTCAIFDFYVPIDEQTTKWDKHGFALYYAFEGHGLSPEQAITEATAAARADYLAYTEVADEYQDGPPPAETFYAIRRSEAHQVTHIPKNPDRTQYA